MKKKKNFLIIVLSLALISCEANIQKSIILFNTYLHIVKADMVSTQGGIKKENKKRCIKLAIFYNQNITSAYLEKYPNSVTELDPSLCYREENLVMESVLVPTDSY
jgi:hypothetical protein